MSQKSLGLIETYGLLSAIEAADAAVKSANVSLVGYEMAKGSGMTTVKVEGDVGAVKAAIAAAKAAVNKIGRVAGVRVIPRPAPGLTSMIRNAETKGGVERRPETDVAPKPEPQNLPEPELEQKLEEPSSVAPEQVVQQEEITPPSEADEQPKPNTKKKK